MTHLETGSAEAAETSSSGEEPGSPPSRQRTHSSFWARASRLLKPAQASLRDDLADALATSTGDDDAFTPDEKAMLHNILRFREVRVEDIMVPRADIEAVDQTITLGELMIVFEESGRSRMPVYCETLDDPRGMVHIRDLLSWVAKQARNKRRSPSRSQQPAPAAIPDGVTVTNALPEKVEKQPRSAKANFDLGRADLQKTLIEVGIIRKILFVPPSMLASDLLRRMQVNRTQMALVIDEYGGTDGLVSHEDIVEMVIGDIEDEHDDEEVMFKKVSDDIFVADARVELVEMAKAVGPDFDVAEQLEDVNTLGGLIFSSLGRIPVRGELVQALPDFEFQILDADPRRVKRVRITRTKQAIRRRSAKSDAEAAPPEPEKKSRRQELSSEEAGRSSATN